MNKVGVSENREYWEDISKKYPNTRQASLGEKMDFGTIKKYINKFKLRFIGSDEHPKASIKNFSLEELKENIITYGGVNTAAIALGLKPESLYNKLKGEGISLDSIMYEYQQKISPEQYPQEMIKGDCVITADFHCPAVSLKWVHRVIETGKMHNIKQLLIAGDFFDFDRLSYWLKQSNAEDTATPLEAELRLASMVLERLETQYDTIHFVGGNHWLRLLKHITFSVSSRRLLGLVSRSNDSRYKINEFFHWIMIDDKVRVTHPGKSRKSDYTLSRDLSYLHPDQWLVVAHRHRVNFGYTPNAIPMLEIGWMGDNERMRYIQHTDSTYYKWVNGFAYYKNGKLVPLMEDNFDWADIDKKFDIVKK